MEMRSMQIPLLCLCFVALCSAFQCPPNFNNFNGTCYRILRTGGMNYFASRRSCRTLDPKADLATIRCRAENEYVLSLLSAESPQQKLAWIGLFGVMNTLNDYFWLLEPEPVPGEEHYRNFKAGRPTFGQRVEFCGEMDTTYGEWNDNMCANSHEYAVCEYPSPVAGGACGYKTPVPVPAPAKQSCSIC